MRVPPPAGARTLAAVSIAFAAGACELQEITIAEAEPFVVVESYLVAGMARPWVAIHGGNFAQNPLVDSALVEIVAPDTTVRLTRSNAADCVMFGFSPTQIPSGGFACYVAPEFVPDSGDAAEPFRIEDGTLYRLRVTLADGSLLAAATRVPGKFALDTANRCYLPPYTQRELRWTAAAFAIGYVSEVAARGLVDALAREGIEVDIEEPVVLRGLSVGEADTTIVLPAEFGVFDRFTLDSELLRALQLGVPPEVDLDITIAAVDQNYVNWARGGDFNPSGVVRVPSVRGAGGTGVFASLTPRFVLASTRDEDAALPPCGSTVED